MDNFRNRVLTVLKDNFMKVHPDAEFDEEMSSSRRHFYLGYLEDNLIEPMAENHTEEFEKALGNQLTYKMRGLRSSSAMAFNLLGNNYISFKPNERIPEGKYCIEYEKELPTLKDAEPASITAELSCRADQTVVFANMNMTDWLFKSPGKIKDVYFKKENYIHPESFKAFNEVFESLMDCELSSIFDTNTVYNRYDAFQILKDALGIYNAFYESQYDGYKKVVLLDTLWQIESPKKLGKQAQDQYEAFHAEMLREYEDFKVKFKPVVQLFGDINIDFDVILLSNTEFLELVEKSDEQLDYLKRYTI